MEKTEDEMLFFDMTIKKIEFVFRFAGFNIRSGARKASDHFKSRCIYIFNMFWINRDLFGGIYWFIDGIRTGKDFLGLTVNAPCLVISILGQFKGILLVKNEKRVHQLMDTLRELDRRERGREQSLVKDEIVKEERKFLKYVLKTLNILYVTLVFSFATSPLVITAVKYYQTQEVELLLPFLILYPFDPFQLKIYPIVYLHQIWSECALCLNICSVDYFFFVCCTYIRIQFRLLKNDLENIISLQKNSHMKIYENDTIKEDFKQLIVRHHDLIESVNILEIIYSKSTLLNFISSSLIICLTGFNVTMVDDLALVVTFLSFLFMGLVQVFFLCFFADLLMTSSVEISDAAYNCQWYMAEAKIVRKLLIVHTRSQKPCKITASGFADVSLNSFMRVLSTAWSYFALLQTMYAK